MLNERRKDGGRFRNVPEVHDIVEIVFRQDVPNGDRNDERQDPDRPTNCSLGNLEGLPRSFVNAFSNRLADSR